MPALSHSPLYFRAEPPDEGSTDASTSGAISPVAWAVPVVLVLLIVPLIVVLVWRRYDPPGWG